MRSSLGYGNFLFAGTILIAVWAGVTYFMLGEGLAMALTVGLLVGLTAAVEVGVFGSLALSERERRGKDS